MARRWLAVCFLCACTTTEEPPASAKAEPSAVEKGRKPNPSAWKEVETPVPVGKKVACASLVATEKIGEKLGRKLELIDESNRDPEATSVCRLRVAKTQPGKGSAPKGMPPGGEELATVTAYCWSTFTVPDVKKKCADGGEDVTTEIGMLTCVKKVPAGDRERAIVTVLEPDTRCKLVVNPGPVNYELAITKTTAQALVDTIDKASLQVAAR